MPNNFTYMIEQILPHVLLYPLRALLQKRIRKLIWLLTLLLALLLSSRSDISLFFFFSPGQWFSLELSSGHFTMHN